MNIEGISNNLNAYFTQLADQRRKAGRRHKLIDIITIAICGIMCGADDWSGIEEYGKAKETWLRQFIELPHGIPSHDTFGRMFSWIDPQAFEKGALLPPMRWDVSKKLQRSWSKKAEIIYWQ